MKINRSNRVDWLDGFAEQVAAAANNVDETAVSKGRQRQANILDEIRSIVSKSPVYSSVQDKVEDLKRRIGLDEYMKMTAMLQSLQTVKVAGELEADIKDMIESYVQNKIQTHHGFISLPALQQGILDTFKQRGVSTSDVEEPMFEQYLFDKIEAAKALNHQHDDYHQLGKGVGINSDNDKLNSDFFGGLNPVKTL